MSTTNTDDLGQLLEDADRRALEFAAFSGAAVALAGVGGLITAGAGVI